MFRQIGEELAVCDVPDPVALDGDVIVDVAAAPILPYAREVFSGKRPMLFELPFTPGTGAIGRISALGGGATEVKVGDWVYCDPTLRARDAQGSPAISLQGLTANGPAALAIQRQYRDGSWAEKLRLPLENVVPIGDIDGAAAARWLTLGTMLVPYGGLSSVGLIAGETVVVNGATGSFGSAAVGVALAMGAARIVATGRNQAALEALASRFGDRVRTAHMTGEQTADTAAIKAAADGGIDVVFDILPPQATAAQVMAAIFAVRPGGRVCLMGGVAAAGGDLSLPYSWLMRNNITIRGQWLGPRAGIGRMVAMVKGGLVDLGGYTVDEWPIASINEAIEHAARTAGAFNKTVLRPQMVG